MPEQIEDLLQLYRTELEMVSGNHIKKAILYGSYARGDFGRDSDIDIMILVDMKDYRDYEDKIYNLTYYFNQKYDMDIMPLIQNVDHFNHWKNAYMFYHNINREGVDIMPAIKEQYITELKKQLFYEMKTRKRNGIYGFIQRTMAYNSNRIEGSTLTERQTASMFETGTISNEEDICVRTKDIEEMTGHFRMFNQAIQTLDQPLSVDLIKQMHYNLKTGVFEDMINGYPCGEFKNRRNIVSNIQTTLPQDVPGDMAALLNTYLQIQTPTVKDLAKLHADYEDIHPFQDGNGRTGRMILFRESLRHNMVPVIIRDANKATYLYALNKAQTAGDLRELTEYFEQEQEKFFDETKDIILPYDVLREIETGKQAGNETNNMLKLL